MDSDNDTLKKNTSTESFDIIDMPDKRVEEDVDVPILDKPGCVDEVVDVMNKNETEREPEISTNPDDLRNAILQMSPEKRSVLFNQIAKFQNLQNNMTNKSLKTVDEDKVEDVREKLKMAMKRKKMQRQGKHVKNIEMEKMKSQLEKINEQLKDTPLEQQNEPIDEPATSQTHDKVTTNLGEAVVLPSAPISVDKAKEVINDLAANELADKMAAELIAEESKNKSSTKSTKKNNKKKSKK